MRALMSHPYNLISGNERGVVLILCLMMLLLLSILGAFATSTSMTELSIAGNFRTADIALNTADAAITQAETDPTIPIYTNTGMSTWSTATLSVGNYNATDVTVNFVAAGLPPIGSGVDANIFQANYFVVSAQGNGPNNSQARIETQIAKIVPK